MKTIDTVFIILSKTSKRKSTNYQIALKDYEYNGYTNKMIDSMVNKKILKLISVSKRTLLL